MSLETDLLRGAAEMAVTRGDWADAARLYRELAEAAPEQPEVQLGLGRALRELGQMAEADAAFTRALGLQPANPAVLLELADVFRHGGRPAEALALYRSALARLPPGAGPAEAVLRDLDSQLPPGFTTEISGRIVLARRARAQGDLVRAAEHYHAVLAALPGLAEIRDRLAECEAPEAPPAFPAGPGAAEALEAALQAEAEPWRIRTGEAGEAPQPPPALAEEGPIALPPLLAGYLEGRPDAPLPPDAAPLAGMQALLAREARLRELATGGDHALAAALLGLEGQPDLPSAAAAAAQGRYFAPIASWLRYRLRHALAEGSFPATQDLPLGLLRFEPDLVFSIAGPGRLPALLSLPVPARDGALFYATVDQYIRENNHALGVPLARMGSRYFKRRDSGFKQQEFNLKAAALLQDAGRREEAVACCLEILAEAQDPRMLRSGLRAGLQILDEAAAKAELLPVLAQRDEALLSNVMDLIFQRGGGRGDMLQRRAIGLLGASLAGPGRPALQLPLSMLTRPALVSQALRHAASALPEARAMQPALRQIAAFASGFTDLNAAEEHLRDLLAAGDQDGITAIGAFITHRYGQRFLQPGVERITTILGSGNVGDTLLYMAGMAAFALASGQPVHILHRESRTALTEFFGAIPGLSFEALPNDLKVPLPLSLNRLARGNVSLFYEVPWYHGTEVARVEEREKLDNFLWHKLAAVALSGATMLPERITLRRPPMAPPPQWDDKATRRFDELGLKPGRTVFLSPQANTLFSLTPSRFTHFRAFWQESIALFRANGFTVASNATNNNRAESLFPDAGVPELDLDLRELPAFVRRCGYFAGVRSGLCDLLALCGLEGVQARTLYMRGAEHCIGLADFGMAEVVADFQRYSPRELAEGIFGDWLKRAS